MRIRSPHLRLMHKYTNHPSGHGYNKLGAIVSSGFTSRTRRGDYPKMRVCIVYALDEEEYAMHTLVNLFSDRHDIPQVSTQRDESQDLHNRWSCAWICLKIEQRGARWLDKGWGTARSYMRMPHSQLAPAHGIAQYATVCAGEIHNSAWLPLPPNQAMDSSTRLHDARRR